MPSRVSLRALVVLLASCTEGIRTAPPAVRGLPMEVVPVDAALPPDFTPPAGPLVINEVEAGDDWVEVKNVSSAMLDVSGFIVTQTDDMGAPEPERSSPFPADTQLPIGGYFLVMAGRAVADGLQTDCAPPATLCLHAEFGISAADGDTLVVLDAAGSVIDELIYPPAAAADGQSWSRIPDGAGPPSPTPPTPIAPNTP